MVLTVLSRRGKMSEYCNNCTVSSDGKILDCACDGTQPDKFSQLDLG